MNVRSDDDYPTYYEENKDNILAGTKTHTHMETTWIQDLLLSLQHYIYLQIPAPINTGENAFITRFFYKSYVILIIPLCYSFITTLITMHIHRLTLISTNIVHLYLQLVHTLHAASNVASWRWLRLATETCRSIKTNYCAISWN